MQEYEKNETTKLWRLWTKRQRKPHGWLPRGVKWFQCWWDVPYDRTRQFTGARKRKITFNPFFNNLEGAVCVTFLLPLSLPAERDSGQINHTVKKTRKTGGKGFIKITVGAPNKWQSKDVASDVLTRGGKTSIKRTGFPGGKTRRAGTKG